MVGLAGHVFKHHPARLIHVPVVGRAAAFENPHVERLKEFAEPLQAAGQRSLRHEEMVHLQRLENPKQGHSVQELVQQKFHPKAAREHPLGNEFRRARRGDNSRNGLALTGGPIALALVNAPHHAHVPMNLLRILRARQRRQRLATRGANSLLVGQVVQDLFRGKGAAALSTMACGAALLASAPPVVRTPAMTVSLVVRATGGITVVRLRGRFRLLRLATEHLLLQPRHSRLRCLQSRGQSLELGRQSTRLLLRLLRLLPPARFPFERASVQRLAILNLPPQIATRLATRAGPHVHADTIQEGNAVCPENNASASVFFSRRPERRQRRWNGFSECLPWHARLSGPKSIKIKDLGLILLTPRSAGVSSSLAAPAFNGGSRPVAPCVAQRVRCGRSSVRSSPASSHRDGTVFRSARRRTDR